MAERQADRLFRQLRSAAAAADGGVADRELLEQFALSREPATFEVLIRRHGPMVLRVCQGVLRDPHAAEDAFQATFLVLLRKAASVRKQASLASWLYKVAYRVSLRARVAAAHRQQRETQVPARVTSDPLDDVTWRELRAILDAELQRLPERYRAPVVLCCLEGWARDEAAQQLGWSVGTLKGRLERGREVLRARLVRRGVTLSAALGAALLSDGAVQAALPATLAQTTLRAALVFSSGRDASAGVVSAQVLPLVREVSRAMTMTKLHVTAAVLLAAGTFLAGAVALAHQVLFVQAPEPQSASDRGTPAQQGPGPARADRQGDPLPVGAIARLGTVRFRHVHTISSVAYSGDGKRVLTGSWDGTVRLWDTVTGQELHRLTAPGDGFSSVALSPDGKTLAGGDMARTLFLWDAGTGALLRRIEKLENTVFGLRFAPDGKTLAGVSGNTVRLWDVATGEERRRRTGPRDDLRPFAFSADLTTFATGLPDRSIELWDLTSAAESRRFPTCQADLACLAIAPDGKALATGGGEGDRTVRLWDRSTGRELHRFEPYRGSVESLAFAADGKALAAGEQNGTIHVYDVSIGKERCRCALREGSWVRALAFAPDGKALAASGTDERSIRFFDAFTGQEQSLFEGHRNQLAAAVITPDGKTLISADNAGTLCRWDLATGQELRRWNANPKDLSAGALAPDGRTLAIAGDRAFRLWDATTGQEIREFRGHKGAPDAVAFSPDGKTLASGTWQDHTIRLWDVVTGRERLRIDLPMPNGHNYGDVPLVFADGGKVLISGSADRANPSLYYWDTATGKELRRVKCPVSRFALSPDGKTLASTSWDKRIHLWDVTTGAETAQIPGDAGPVAFAPDGRTLAYGGTDGVIHLWEVAARQERHACTGHQPGGDSRGTFAAGVAVLAFTPDGRTLVSGGGDTTLLLWDVYGAGPSTPAARTPDILERRWAELDGDAAQAYEAVGALLAARGEVVAFLKGQLHPAAPCDPRRLAGWIADLDSEQFAVRDRAARALELLNESAAPLVRSALGGNPSAEVRRRLEEVVARLDGPPTGSRLREIRAVEVLEHLATPEALDLLRVMAGGVAEARLTGDARAALERRARRGGSARE